MLRLGLLVIAVLLLPPAAPAQRPGTYASPSDFESWCLTLRRNGQFRYRHHSCTGGEEGTGTYRKEGAYLRLVFGEDRSPRRRRMLAHTGDGPGRADSASYRIHAVDPNGAPASVLLHLTCGPFSAGAWTDITGVAQLDVPLLDSPVVLHALSTLRGCGETFSLARPAAGTHQYTLSLPGCFYATIPVNTVWEGRLKVCPKGLLLRSSDAPDAPFRLLRRRR